LVKSKFKEQIQRAAAFEEELGIRSEELGIREEGKKG